MNYIPMLFEKYGTALLTPKQTSEVTGRSVASLTMDRRAGEGIPFKRLGSGENSPVRYPLEAISTWINDTEKIF